MTSAAPQAPLAEQASSKEAAETPPASSSDADQRPATASDDTPADDADDKDDPDKNCPICAYVGAGPCADVHKAWSSCRKLNKEDFVEACKPSFVHFFQCMTSTPESAEYHAPLLRAFGAPPAVTGEGEGGKEKDEGKKGAGEERGEAAAAVVGGETEGAPAPKTITSKS